MASDDNSEFHLRVAMAILEQALKSLRTLIDEVLNLLRLVR